jgi:uncharacterized protein (TIRG00374 family)
LIVNRQKVKETGSQLQKAWPFLKIVVTISLLGLGIWYILDGIGLSAISEVFSTSKIGFILLSLLVVLTMNLFKAWRWRILFAAESDPPPFPTLFWAIMLGQYVNLVVPFLRLGEVARIYVLRKQSRTPGALTLGTLVVEKVLEMVILALTLLVILPFIALPDYVNHPGIQLGIVAGIMIVGLYIVAYQTNYILKVCSFFTRRLPMHWAQRLMNYIVQGLESVAALRDNRTLFALMATSIMGGVTAVLTPYVLLLAFDLPLGLARAALIHIVVMIALTPPSTPGKIGVFDGAAALTLVWFGIQSEAAIASFTITYHLAAVLPPVILGMIAASRTNWQWKQKV